MPPMKYRYFYFYFTVDTEIHRGECYFSVDHAYCSYPIYFQKVLTGSSVEQYAKEIQQTLLSPYTVNSTSISI